MATGEYYEYSDLINDPFFIRKPRRLSKSGIIYHPFDIERDKKLGPASSSRHPWHFQKWDICDLEGHQDNDELVKVDIKVPQYQDNHDKAVPDKRFKTIDEKYSFEAATRLVEDYVNIGCTDKMIIDYYHVSKVSNLQNVIEKYIEDNPYGYIPQKHPETLWFTLNKYTYKRVNKYMLAVIDCSLKNGIDNSNLIDIFMEDSLDKAVDMASQKYSGSTKTIFTGYHEEFIDQIKKAFPKVSVLYSPHSVIFDLQEAYSRTKTDNRNSVLNVQINLTTLLETSCIEDLPTISEMITDITEIIEKLRPSEEKAHSYLETALRKLTAINNSNYKETISNIYYSPYIPFRFDQMLKAIMEKNYYPARLRLILLYTAFQLVINKDKTWRDKKQELDEEAGYLEYSRRPSLSQMAFITMKRWADLEPAQEKPDWAASPLGELILMMESAVRVSSDLYANMFWSPYYRETIRYRNVPLDRNLRRHILSKIYPVINHSLLIKDQYLSLHRFANPYSIGYMLDYNDGHTNPQVIDQAKMDLLGVSGETLLDIAVRNIEPLVKIKKEAISPSLSLYRFSLKSVSPEITGISAILTKKLNSFIRNNIGTCYIYLINHSFGYILPSEYHTEDNLKVLQNLYYRQEQKDRFDDIELYFNGSVLVETYGSLYDEDEEEEDY